MSRYVYSCCEADGCLLLYLESTVEEDKLDMVENQMPLGYHRHIYRRGKSLVDETRAARGCSPFFALWHL